MCLKFQLTKISARWIVAVAIWIQSSKLVAPTTFSSTYFVASARISSVISTLSKLSFGKSVKYSFTFLGAFTNSVSTSSEYMQMIFPSLIRSNNCNVNSSNSLSNTPPKTMCQGKIVVSFHKFSYNQIYENLIRRI